MSELRFDNKVVVVTGAGAGLGRAYALFFGSRGASVVVNDLGGATNGEAGSNQRVADHVVSEIVNKGGKAVANYDSVVDGDKIIETAVKAFGTVHIVINNAGILRDVSLKNMKETDWDLIYQVHVYGSYKVTKAAWPYLRKQKFGRIINTTSAAGLYGNFGQTNYSAAKLALVGFAETLAKEGAKYNITANAIAPIAGSRLTQSVMPEELIEALKPEFVVPLVAYLVHESTSETYGIYELGAGYFSKVRWERGSGNTFKLDSSFTPSAVLKNWSKVTDFSSPEYPNGPKDLLSVIESSKQLPSNAQGETISFKDQVIVVTGAGNGIGRAYALLLGKLGAKVVVNDFADPTPVVEEIKKAGGIAVGDRSNVVQGEKVIQTAIDNFGAVHGVINNAGILRDKSFANITDQEWQAVFDVHLKGTFAVTKAAWPYFLKQKYGRVINTTSTSGIYGNFGQTNYGAAKAGILGFSKALAVEGKKYNIFVNTIAPTAGTNMTKTVFTEEMLELFKPEYIAPLSVLLASDKAPVTGGLYEIGAGWIGQTRFQKSGGVGLPTNTNITPEQIAENWNKITDFDDGRASYPNTPAESTAAVIENLSNVAAESQSSADNVVGKVQHGADWTFTERDIALYNLGIGATAKDLKYVYEGADDFTAIPSFGVIGYFTGSPDYAAAVPNFNPMRLLHGEHFLEVLKWPLPTSGTLKTDFKLIELVDKGKAAIAVAEYVTKTESGEPVFRNVGSVFLGGSGGFGGKKKGEDRGAITAANNPPSRAPDFVAEYQTSPDQAAIYRLSGDYNPLHIDPDFSAVGGFKTPILHGLCTFGISARLLVDKYGPFKNIKTRFANYVIPGDKIKVEAWKEGNKVIFQTIDVTRGKIAISNAAVELPSPNGSKL